MAKFRKIPVEIEAVRLTECVKISTLEGIMIGNPGDWLITGVAGEQYPCKDSVFRQTYKPSDRDKCDYCKFGGQDNRPCDTYEVCVFEWKEDEGGDA
jgi:hypothetical protein